VSADKAWTHLDALAEHLRRYIIEHERDPLRTICLLLLEIEIERLRQMHLR
jgi:hypothetical protein